MSKKYLFLALALLAQFSLRSGDISILTTNNLWQRYAGYFSDLEIEITPDNHYARIDMTFNVNVDSINYYQGQYYYGYGLPNYQNQLLEAQILFSMPKAAYFYDSYLWLNSSTIIRAKIIGNAEASRVYDSIVNRKSDPSILRKNQYNETYSLNIFPISTTYSRKVKISFALPFQLRGSNKEYLELPVDFLNLLDAKQVVKLILNKTIDKTNLNSLYPLLSKVESETNQTKTISILAQDLKKTNSAYLEFQANNLDIISFYSQVKDSSEGYYDLRVNTELLPNLTEDISAYQIHIPMLPNGITYSNWNENNNTMSLKQAYHECGQFYGNINFSDSISLIYKVKNNVYTYKQAIKQENIGDFIFQNWTNLFCSQNTNVESKNASLKNRVLTSQTAFLALENGDTVSSTKNNSMTGGDQDYSSIKPIELDLSINIYPNPIINLFTISAKSKILSIRIHSLTGQEIYFNEPKLYKKEIEINSSDIQLEKGIYLVTVETEIGVETIRVIKE